MKKLIFVVLLFASSWNFFAQEAKVTEKNGTLGNKASIAGKTEGTVTRDEIINAKMIMLNDDIKKIYHIYSFKLTIVCKDEDIVVNVNDENGELTQKMINAIKGATSGCKLYFEYIKVVESSNLINTRKTVMPLAFELK